MVERMYMYPLKELVEIEELLSFYLVVDFFCSLYQITLDLLRRLQKNFWGDADLRSESDRELGIHHESILEAKRSKRGACL